MQELRTTHKFENLAKRQSSLTGATERNGFQKNVINPNPSVMVKRTAERLQVKNVSKTDHLNAPSNELGTTVTNNNGFVTAKEFDNLVKNRKRYSTEAGAEEPARKKMQTNNNAVMETTKGELVKEEVKQQRCITGDVSQLIKLNKDCPSSLNHFYEVYAKVYKVDSSKAGQKTLLLRNNSGPVLEAIFHEIDVKMVPVKRGDAVRCVGKLINNSQLQLFKISVISENYTALVSRLHSISNYVVSRNNGKAPP